MPAEENEGILFCALAKRFLFNVSNLFCYLCDAATAAVASAVAVIGCCVFYVIHFRFRMVSGLFGFNL